MTLSLDWAVDEDQSLHLLLMLESEPEEDVGPEAHPEPQEGEDVVVVRDGEDERGQLV